MSADELAKQVAERVRELITDAEQRAGEIVREAEEQAARIRSRAEAEARGRVDQARRALEELEGKLGVGEPEEPIEAKEPAPASATEAVTEEPAAEEPPEPRPAAVGDRPSTEELLAKLKAGQAQRGDDVAAARLVAMKMALDGSSREDVDRHLAESYDLPDRAKLLDEVFEKVGK